MEATTTKAIKAEVQVRATTTVVVVMVILDVVIKAEVVVAVVRINNKPNINLSATVILAHCPVMVDILGESVVATDTVMQPTKLMEVVVE